MQRVMFTSEHSIPNRGYLPLDSQRKVAAIETAILISGTVSLTTAPLVVGGQNLPVCHHTQIFCRGLNQTNFTLHRNVAHMPAVGRTPTMPWSLPGMNTAHDPTAWRIIFRVPPKEALDKV